MYPLNSILVICFSLLIILGCEDKDEPSVGEELEPCNSYCESSQVMDCVEGQCLCPQDMFFTDWQHKGDFCTGLTDSFYVRVGHEGNIEYFEAIDVLRLPSNSSIFSRSSTSITEDYPEQFIAELFTSRSGNLDYDRFLGAHLVLVFDNDIPGNEAFPLSGKSTRSPSNYRPRGDYYDVDSNFYYANNFVWDIEYKEESATLKIDLYSWGEEGIYLDDEITMYFERYRE